FERYFLTWQNTGGGWQLWSAEAALVAAGLVVAIVVGFALFYTNLIDKLASPGSARGLITFLFSFITIAVILIVIIALLWMDKDQDLDNRFTKAKDIIAISGRDSRYDRRVLFWKQSHRAAATGGNPAGYSVVRKRNGGVPPRGGRHRRSR